VPGTGSTGVWHGSRQHRCLARQQASTWAAPVSGTGVTVSGTYVSDGTHVSDECLAPVSRGTGVTRAAPVSRETGVSAPVSLRAPVFRRWAQSRFLQPILVWRPRLLSRAGAALSISLQ